MKDESKDDEHYQKVHLEVKFQFDQVSQDDQVYYLTLQLVRNFLHQSQLYNNFSLHRLSEKDPAQHLVTHYCKTHNHIVQDKNTPLVCLVGHHSLKVTI